MSGDREVLERSVAESSRADAPRKVIRRSSKLTVGAADDPYEREADLVADQVMNVLRRSPDEAPFASTSDAGANGRIRSNPYGPATSSTTGGSAQRSIQRKSSAPATTATPIGPTLSDSPGTVRRLGVWDWIWGGTKKVGEGMDTSSATMEAVDEGHKVVNSLSESTMLTGGLKSGSDTLGTVGGLVGGTKDLSEGVGSMSEDGLGVGNTMKTVGGLSGLLGGVNKGMGAFGPESYDELIKTTIGIGGEELGGWFDFISGGTKVISGAYLTGKSQLQYNAVRKVRDQTAVPKVREIAEKMMEIINEKWYMGMWDVGVGTMDMVATSTVPGYTAASKTVGAVSKMVGGDLLWGALSWASGGRVRTNDVIEDQINDKIDELCQGAVEFAKKGLDGNEADNIAALYEQAKVVAPKFAEVLSRAVKELPRNGYAQKKQQLKGRVWT